MEVSAGNARTTQKPSRFHALGGEAIAATLAQVAAGAAADLAPLHVTSDIAFAAVGMQDDVRALEHQQQLLLVGVQPLEQLVEGGEGGALGEDGVVTRLKRRGQCRIGIALIGFEVRVQVPNFAAYPFLILTMAFIERDQLVDQALGVDPAQGMEQNRKLPGSVADDDQVGREPLVDQSAEQRPFRGDAPMAFDVDPQGIEVLLPARDLGDRRMGMRL